MNIPQKGKTNWTEIWAQVVLLVALISGMIVFHLQKDQDSFASNLRLPILAYSVAAIAGTLGYFWWLKRSLVRKSFEQPAIEVRFEASPESLERIHQRRKSWLLFLTILLIVFLWKTSWFFQSSGHPDWRLLLGSVALCVAFVLPFAIANFAVLVTVESIFSFQGYGFAGNNLLWLHTNEAPGKVNLGQYHGWCTRRIKDGVPHKIELMILPDWTFKDLKSLRLKELFSVRPSEDPPPRTRFIFPLMARDTHGFLMELSKRLPELRSDARMKLARMLMVTVYLFFLIVFFRILDLLPCWPGNTWQGMIAIIVGMLCLIAFGMFCLIIDGRLKAKQYRRVNPVPV